MDGSDYRSVDYSGGVALVIGSEGRGMSRLVREKCDFIVSLPMKGKNKLIECFCGGRHPYV